MYRPQAPRALVSAAVQPTCSRRCALLLRQRHELVVVPQRGGSATQSIMSALIGRKHRLRLCNRPTQRLLRSEQIASWRTQRARLVIAAPVGMAVANARECGADVAWARGSRSSAAVFRRALSRLYGQHKKLMRRLPRTRCRAENPTLKASALCADAARSGEQHIRVKGRHNICSKRGAVSLRAGAVSRGMVPTACATQAGSVFQTRYWQRSCARYLYRHGYPAIFLRIRYRVRSPPKKLRGRLPLREFRRFCR